MIERASIERASGAHAALLAEIHAAAFPAPDVWSRDVMSLQLDLPTTFGLIHAAGGFILGRVTVDEAEVLTIAVIPAQRRAGLGARLLRAAMDHAARAWATTMFLEVAVTNQPARALYEAHGFVRVGLRRHYYSDGTDALVLRAPLV